MTKQEPRQKIRTKKQLEEDVAELREKLSAVDTYTYKRLGEVTEEISAVEKAALETDTRIAERLGEVTELSAACHVETAEKINALEKRVTTITHMHTSQIEILLGSYEKVHGSVDKLTLQLAALTKTMSEAFEGTRRTAGILNGKVNMFGEAAKKADAIIEAKVDALLKVSTSTDTPLAYWEELTAIQGKYLKLLISDSYKDRITDFLTEVKALKEKHVAT